MTAPSAPGAPIALTPSAAGRPSGGASGPRRIDALAAVYRLLLLSVATRGRLLGIAALSALFVAVGVIIASIGPDEPVIAATGYVNASLSTIVPVAVLVFGAGTLGDLVDDGTLVYLWLRPVPSWIHITAAWLATVTITLPLVGLPTLLAAAVISSDAGVLAGTAIGATVTVAAYSALFVTAGIRFRRALPWGLAYILIWEGFVAIAGKTASKLAVRSYVRSILSVETGVRIKLASFTLASGILVPLIVGAVVLAYGARRLAKTDVP